VDGIAIEWHVGEMSEKTPVASGAAEPVARDNRELAAQLEPYRTELTGYCYRMLGSAFEAEDAVQESMVRAWRAIDDFEGRASLRSWLYRIATNVCLSMVGARQRRARPMDFGPARSAESALGTALDEATWLEPVPDGLVVPTSANPAELALSRETIRLAFVAALQLLPPKQRAALILHEVLHWKATEIGELLETSVASINSALQRARATLSAHSSESEEAVFTKPKARAAKYGQVDAAQEALLGRYVEAFERWDVESLVSLLHEDATLSMPPYALWLRGPSELRKWWLGPGSRCAGSRLIPLSANGLPAFAQYKPMGEEGNLAPFAIHVLEIEDGRLVGHNSFLDAARLFPLFGLPLRPAQ
jgi:RNA polymerase sigma-70 factor (ECF subfamily)